MSDAVSYKGKALVQVHVVHDRKKVRYNIVCRGDNPPENIGNLIALLNLEDSDIIKLNDGNMSYGDFKKTVLSKTKRIYLSSLEHVLDQV